MFCKTVNLYKTVNIYKTLNIRRVLLPLNSRNGTYKVSEDKASGPVLDVEEVTILLSTNAKGYRILFSRDLYIYLIRED